MKKHWKRTIIVASALALVALTAFSAVALAAGRGPGNGFGNNTTGELRNPRGGTWQSGGNYAATPLTEAEIEALNSVLQDEYHAWAVYDQVIQDFGEVVPFVAIRNAEARHAAAVQRQFEKYGLPIPENQWIGNVDSFASVEAACTAAAQAEIANASLYDDALANTTRADLTRVFSRLQSASLNNHLPAFQACAAS